MLTPSSLSHADIVCHTCPGESVVTQTIFSGDGLDRGNTPNLNFLVSSKYVSPSPRTILAESTLIDSSITITYFLVRNISCTNATCGFSVGIMKCELGVPLANKDLKLHLISTQKVQ